MPRRQRQPICLCRCAFTTSRFPAAATPAAFRFFSACFTPVFDVSIRRRCCFRAFRLITGWPPLRPLAADNDYGSHAATTLHTPPVISTVIRFSLLTASSRRQLHGQPKEPHY